MSPEAARLVMALNSAMTAVLSMEMARVSARSGLANLNDAMDEALEAKIVYARQTKAAEKAHDRKSLEVLTKGLSKESLP